MMVFCGGCASALHDEPQLEVASDERSAVDLYREANGLWSERHDETKAARARDLFAAAVTADPSCFECWQKALTANAYLLEHEANSERRKTLASEGVVLGQLCLESFPDAPECRYRLAIAVGQQARERPSTGMDGVDVMVELLNKLVGESPDLDYGGPARVLALVLLRAPGWPSGPGDPELALELAASAAGAFPDYPPNQLVYAEALLENDHIDRGRQALEQGRQLALTLEQGGDHDAARWRGEADEILATLD
jgi:hypothetical protein